MNAPRSQDQHLYEHGQSTNQTQRALLIAIPVILLGVGSVESTPPQIQPGEPGYSRSLVTPNQQTTPVQQYQQYPQYQQTQQYQQPLQVQPYYYTPQQQPQRMPPQQPQRAQPQFVQPQFVQPQYGQPQYGQPQYVQPQQAQPQQPRATQPAQQGRKIQPKLDAIAETSLLMEGLAQSNMRGLERMLSEPPTEDKAWAFARGQALLLAETGNLLMLRPPHNDGQPYWFMHATAFRKQAEDLARTLERKDYRASKAGVMALANTCNRCHQTFRVTVQVTPFQGPTRKVSLDE